MMRLCPACGEPLTRIPRRPVDRLLSLFRPVHRYQCTVLECEWQGNLPRQASVPDERFSPMTTLTGTH